MLPSLETSDAHASRMTSVQNAADKSFVKPRSKVLSIHGFSGMQAEIKTQNTSGSGIIPTLLGFIEGQDVSSGGCLLMPSLLALAKYFDVPPSEVHAAFARLKSYGYDVMIPGHYGHITLWMPIKSREAAPITRASPSAAP